MFNNIVFKTDVIKNMFYYLFTYTRSIRHTFKTNMDSK